MKIDTPEHMEHLRRVFPLIPEALERLHASIPPEIFLEFRTGTRSAMIHDMVMTRAEAVFGDDSPIRVVTSRGLRYFTLPTAGVRLHRGSRRGHRIMVNHTIQSKEWNAKPRQFVFEGFVDPNDRFHLVYAPDVTWTMVESCSVGLYYGNEPVDSRLIDVEAWYAAREIIPTRDPEVEDIPEIILKPEVARLNLEERNDAQGT